MRERQRDIDRERMRQGEDKSVVLQLSCNILCYFVDYQLALFMCFVTIKSISSIFVTVILGFQSADVTSPSALVIKHFRNPTIDEFTLRRTPIITSEP